MFSKLITKTSERRQWCRSGVFIVNFEHISQLVSVSNANFEHVIADWVFINLANIDTSTTVNLVSFIY